MKHIIKNLLMEMTSNDELPLSDIEIVVLKYLTKTDLTPKSNQNSIIKILMSDFDFTGEEAIKIHSLFVNNYRKDSDYESIITPDRISTGKSSSTPNKRGGEFVINRIPFTGSNTMGRYIGGVYVVTSYNWYPIFVFKGGQWYENVSGYSMSTKKQMSQLRPYGENITKLSTDELKDLYN